EWTLERARSLLSGLVGPDRQPGRGGAIRHGGAGIQWAGAGYLHDRARGSGPVGYRGPTRASAGGPYRAWGKLRLAGLVAPLPDPAPDLGRSCVRAPGAGGRLALFLPRGPFPRPSPSGSLSDQVRSPLGCAGHVG